MVAYLPGGGSNPRAAASSRSAASTKEATSEPSRAANEATHADHGARARTWTAIGRRPSGSGGRPIRFRGFSTAAVRTASVPLDQAIEELACDTGFSEPAVYRAIMDSVDDRELLLLYRDGELHVAPGPRAGNLAALARRCDEG